MNGVAEPSCLFLFETTHQAMWAEDVAREGGIPAEVVAAPPEAKAKCGLALRTTGAHCHALEVAMEAQGIGFQPFTAS
jgi:hypothetical protein